MTGLAQGFVGARLTEARRARGISATDLAGLVEISVQSISKYENGHQVPRLEVMHALADKLNMPRDYFLRPCQPLDSKPVFFRARLSAPAVMIERAAVRLEWMKEVVDYIASFFELPQPNIPKIDFPETGFPDGSFVEDAAAAIRAHWGIRPGPMPDVIERLENNGILVSRIHVGVEKMDAFSQWSDKFGIPFVMLSRDKASAARQRFDALHELAHIVVHANVPARRLNDRAFYKAIEKQADQIASALLLPADDFLGELYAPSLDAFLTLKERWGASVGAMIMRCKSLEIIDEDTVRRMFINYNRRGWRTGEPLDGKMQKEEPHLLRRSFEMLLEKGVQTVPEVLSALPFPAEDLEEIADLEPGTFTGKGPSRAEPILRDLHRGSNVVSMADRRPFDRSR